jgi:hypothetical protein
MGDLVSLLARRLHIYRPSLEYDLSKSPTVMGTDCLPIYEAALVGDWEAVRRHLADEPQTAAHVDNSGNTTLHICCRRCHPPIDVIDSLIKAYPKTLVRRTVDGLTPLHFAAYFAADGHVIDVMMKELSDLLERAKDGDHNDNNNHDDDDLEAGDAHRQSTPVRSSSSSSSSRRRNDANSFASSSSFLVRLITLGMYKSKALQIDGDASQTDALPASVEACLPSEPLLAPDRILAERRRAAAEAAAENEAGKSASGNKEEAPMSFAEARKRLEANRGDAVDDDISDDDMSPAAFRKAAAAALAADDGVDQSSPLGDFDGYALRGSFAEQMGRTARPRLPARRRVESGVLHRPSHCVRPETKVSARDGAGLPDAPAGHRRGAAEV